MDPIELFGSIAAVDVEPSISLHHLRHIQVVKDNNRVWGFALIPDIILNMALLDAPAVALSSGPEAEEVRANKYAARRRTICSWHSKNRERLRKHLA